MHRFTIAVVILTLGLAILSFAFFWYWNPQRIATQSAIQPDFDTYDAGIAVTTIILSLGLGLANFSYSYGEHRVSITPSIHTKLSFRPIRGYAEVRNFTQNQLWLEVTNLHSAISPMDMAFKTSFRTVDSAKSKHRLVGISYASDWKPTLQRLEFIRPNEQKRLQVLINIEATIEPLNPKLFEVQRDGTYATFEVLPVPVYVEIRVECEYSLSIPGTGRQRIKPVHFYCSPSGENPIHWSVYIDAKRRMSVATTYEDVQ